jgi:hypothetical protein
VFGALRLRVLVPIQFFPIDIRGVECEVITKFLLSYPNATWLLIVSNMAVDLTPLDPESNHIREVYAHYGLAMYWAQCLEQSIFQHLLFFDHFPKAIQTCTTAEHWVAAIDRYEARELKQTMGRLIYRLREAGQTTSSIEQLLDRALKNRNWLAHAYFSDRAVDFMSPGGRERMLEELGALKDHFVSTASEIDEITMPVAQRYGLTAEKLAGIEAQLLVGQGRTPRDI